MGVLVLVALAGCAGKDSPMLQVAKRVQHNVHPDNFSPEKLAPDTLFMIQRGTDPPLQKVFPTDLNLAQGIEPGAGTKVLLRGMDETFTNELPGGYEHRRVKLEIYQHLGDAWYDGFIDVARKKNSDEPWRVLLQCTSASASLGEDGTLHYDPLSTNCYWSHFHHDWDWYKPYPTSVKRDKPTRE